MAINDRLDCRIALLEQQNAFSKKAISLVIGKIKKGGSELKAALATDQVSMADVVKAIKHNRCLRIAERDFGATYLGQIIGTAIREMIPLAKINDVRPLFGLKKLPPSELIEKQKQAPAQRSIQR